MDFDRLKVRSKRGLLVAAGVLAANVLPFGANYHDLWAALRTLKVAKSSARMPAPQPPEPGWVQGRVVHWRPQISLSGKLLPIREASLSFDVSGQLGAVRVRDGDQVRAGQQLAELDRTDARAAHAAAFARLHAAEVQLVLADENEQRARALAATGAPEYSAGSQRLEAARTAFEVALSQAEVASAALAPVRLQAPFAGRVSAAPGMPGRIVTRGVELFRIEDISTLRLCATLSAADAAFAQPGAEIELEGGRRGQVTAVLSAADPHTAGSQILAEFDNTGPKPVLPQVDVRATLTAATSIDVVELPSSVLRPRSRDEVVIAAGERLAIVRVVFARASDGSLLVRAGLRPEDRVLVAPRAQIKTGDLAPRPALAQVRP